MADHHHEHHHQEQHQHRHEHQHDGLAELLDLDAEVLHEYLDEVMAWIAGRAADGPCRRIVDLGCGTGTGSVALARRFPDAEVTAVDVDPDMLRHLDRAVRDRGLSDRIRTVAADLDGDWPALGPADLFWASGSMHHMADPDRALAEVLAALRPGGRLALAELDSFPRFLPADIGFGRPGLEERCHAAMAERRSHDLPHIGSDWAARLAKAGFVIEDERRFAIHLTPPLPVAAGRYARASLRRAHTALADQLDAEDLAALDRLTGDGPDGVEHRTDLSVRADRLGWIARRP